MIDNDSFESESSKSTYQLTADGTVHHTVFDNITAPDPWTAFWREGMPGDVVDEHVLRRPEFKHIRLGHNMGDETRMRTGDKAAMWFTPWGLQDCGIYRTYTVEKNQKAKVQAYGHTWYSNADDKPHSPPLHEDHSPLTWANMYLQVGIDPTGGTDPWAHTVEWSAPVERYGQYNAPIISPEVVAESTEVTVFLRTFNTHPLTYNDAYWDDVYFEAQDMDVDKVDYEVTVHVPAQNVESFERVAEQAKSTLSSVVPSHDDTGRLTNVICPSGEGGRAILYDIPTESHQAFLDYYAERYPFTRVEFSNVETTIWDRDIIDELVHNDVFENKYLKEDNGWWQRTLDQIDGLTLHHASSNSPHAAAEYHIGKYGGLPSIQYNIWITETGEILLIEPLESGVWHDNTGHKNTHLAVVLAGNLLENMPSDAQLNAAVKVTAWAVNHPEMNITLESVKGHRDYSSTDCPGWQSGWKTKFYTRLREALGVEEPENEPTLIFAMHAQHNMEDLPEASDRMGAVKTVEDAGSIPVFTDDTFVVWRNWLGPDEIEKYTQGGPKMHFDEQIVPYLDYYGDKIDAVEDGMNEEVAPHNDGKNEWCIWWATTTARLVREYTNGKIKTVMLNPGPGAFPLKGEGLRLFKPVFEASHKYGDYIGCHPYTPATEGLTWINEWYPLRFMQYDAYSRQEWGYYPLYLGTEAGPIGGGVNENGVPVLNAGSGWRHSTCLGGDWGLHQEIMGDTAKAIIEWNKKHGWRFRHMFLFTVFGWGWDNFRYYSEQYNAVADLAEALGQ